MQIKNFLDRLNKIKLIQNNFSKSKIDNFVEKNNSFKLSNLLSKVKQSILSKKPKSKSPNQLNELFASQTNFLTINLLYNYKQSVGTQSMPQFTHNQNITSNHRKTNSQFQQDKVIISNDAQNQYFRESNQNLDCKDQISQTNQNLKDFFKNIIISNTDQVKSKESNILPKINQNTFLVKSNLNRKESPIIKEKDKKQKQFYDQNQFRWHAISSQKGYRNAVNTNTEGKNENNKQSLMQLLKKQNKQKQPANNKNKKAQSSLILLPSKTNKDKQKIDTQDLYQQYLSLEELQIHTARQRLEKQMLKYLPKNGSLTQFYGQKQIMFAKQAKLEQSQLNKQMNAVKSARQGINIESDNKNQKQRKRKLLLNEILKNKAINFKNKVKNHSQHSIRQNVGNKSMNEIKLGSPFDDHIKQTYYALNKIQRPRTKSNLDPYSPSFSQTQQFKNRFQFFPQPKDLSKKLNTILSSRRQYGQYNPSSALRQKTRKHSIASLSHLELAAQENILEKQIFNTIQVLQQNSEIQTKKSQYLISSSIKKQKQFELKYTTLNDQANEAIYGFSNLKLEQQTSDDYKEQLRNMWMKNDSAKGKGVKKNNRLNKNKKTII